MNSPAITTDFNIPSPPELLAELDLKQDQIVSFGIFDSKHLIEIKNELQLLALKPNFDGLKALKGRDVVITCKSESENIDFTSRYFAPWVSVNEDPVTGSAHCALAVYWGEKLKKTALTGYQASKRGGFVKVELLEGQRVKLIGNATTVIKGTMMV